MKILVTGGHGQLGRCIYDVLCYPLISVNNEYVFLSHSEFDITDEGMMERYLFYNPDVKCIINCAAYTNVDKAEQDEYNAYKVNSYGVKKLVDICEKYDIMLFHISTDYVYKDNQGIVTEESEIGPINVYGKSKRDGEIHIINSNLNKWYILRTSWLYSEYEGNFFTKILNKAQDHSYYNKLTVVTDEIGSPTYAKSLAEMLVCIIENEYYNTSRFERGIYNCSGNGLTSRYDFASNIIGGGYHIIVDGKELGVRVPIDKITQKELNLPAARPKCIIMNNDKIYSCIPVEQRPWLYDLQDCITNYEKLLNYKNLVNKTLYGTTIRTN